MNKFSAILLATCFIACSPKIKTLSVHFDESPVPPKPDYNNPTHWASLPTKRDAADSVPLKSNLKDEQATANADVFFIHPTIFTYTPTDQYQWNGDVNDQVLNTKTQLSTILNQASIFNGSCKIYAPYYRQAHYHAFITTNRDDAKRALDLAYGDVRTAFDYYLKNYNSGRPIVIASHSQGTVHAERLLKEYFDGKELKNQLVMAYLVGRAVSPNAFATIKPTEKPDEAGVWASWCTFGREFYPSRYNDYYKGSQSTNPLLWSSSKEFAPKELNLGGVGLHFTFAPQAADAQNQDGMLWINKPYIRGRAFVKNTNWHRADMNLFWMNIRENVKLRIEKYFQPK